MTEEKKIARKYMAHYLDSGFGADPATATWYRLGEDLEEFNVEMNADTEVKKNILGTTSFTNSGYQPSADADPFYAREGDALFDKLQEIIDTQATDDTTKTQSLEVHLWKKSGDTGSVYEAYVQDCYVVPTSYGGNTSGYQIPFTINLVGEKTKGTFDLTSKKFTAAT